MAVKNRFAEYFEMFLGVLLPKKKHSVVAQRQGTAAIIQRLAPIQNNDHLAFLSYRDVAIKHFLYAIKYERHRESITLAADIFWEYISGEAQEEEALQKMHYALCAIPITQERKRRNGYNHLYAMLDVFYHHASDAGLHIQDKRGLLAWTRQVSRQSVLQDRSERLRNVSGAMTATERLPPNTICFVIDDVTTTGATLTEARRVLMKHGAHTVITLALAH
ncbi:MAG: hypothetical protein OXB96_01555 [Candidatus Kaiserbacteria bacterium]|nr:hypothetical protein [Candidatus Kaiserbacteria bacterium]